MVSSLMALADLLDSWSAEGRIGIDENEVAIVASGLNDVETASILPLVGTLNWACTILDDALQPIDGGALFPEMGPFIATITKPLVEGVATSVTRTGLSQALAKEQAGGIWQIASCTKSFATGLVSFSPWGHGDVFVPASETKSPLELVRETTGVRLVPADVRMWILRTRVTEEHWTDPAFQVFASTAAPFLMRSIASDVPDTRTVVFNGPPRLSVSVNGPLLENLGMVGMRALQTGVAWVYEDPASAEQRHALFAAEISRSVRRDQPIGEAFREVGSEILQSARLAYQLSLSDLSREAIKAQGDLRKAIADDTAKAADSTRTLTNAMAAAIATGIGLLAARSVAVTEPWILSAIAVVVAAYLLVATLTGWMYLENQRRLRAQWRQRFYRFVSDEDYTAMVITPSEEADRPYHVLGTVSVVISLLLLVLSLSLLSLI